MIDAGRWSLRVRGGLQKQAPRVPHGLKSGGCVASGRPTCARACFMALVAGTAVRPNPPLRMITVDNGHFCFYCSHEILHSAKHENCVGQLCDAGHGFCRCLQPCDGPPAWPRVGHAHPVSWGSCGQRCQSYVEAICSMLIRSCTSAVCAPSARCMGNHRETAL